MKIEKRLLCHSYSCGASPDDGNSLDREGGILSQSTHYAYSQSKVDAYSIKYGVDS